MTFLEVLRHIDIHKILEKINNSNISEVEAVLDKDKINFEDFLCLLSRPADDLLEKMAVRAQELTLKFFGRTILLYAPLYLCNECDNHCKYCGFSQNLKENRVCLSIDDAVKEAGHLYQKGIRHILLVSGEKRAKVTLDYLETIIQRLRDMFDSISLEIFPLDGHEYNRLFMAGADGLTIYQEVYNNQLYKFFHPSGPKSNYNYRILTPERAAGSGFYRINIGSLLGLGEWEEEAALLGLHLAYLKKIFWQSQIAVSFPRLKSCAASFRPPRPVTDRQLVQMICALRIFQPSAGLVVSTRELPELRDELIPLGITQMSAGSKTNPGGYLNEFEAQEQFEVSDKRSVEEICVSISKKGYEPVFKDWDRAFIK
jgi:2-iminoacetate synthase